MRALSFRDKAFRVFVIVMSILVIFITAYPMYFVLIASFSNAADVANGKVWLFPNGIYLDGYKKIIEHAPIWIGYRNTLIYTFSFTLLSLVLTIPAAYALSRREPLLNRPLMTVFIITMFFSGGLIPSYMLIRDIGLIDNPLVMILPGSVNVFNMIIARTFFRSFIPPELHDSAVIDGCGEFRYFNSIALPLSKAIVAVIALYSAVAMWNSYFNALLYLKGAEKFPLQLILRDIMLEAGFNTRTSAGNSGSTAQQRLRELLKYCSIVVTVIPIMSVYPFLQKYFAKGVMLGAIKG
jgi:putative aldouronate transport system permease protein